MAVAASRVVLFLTISLIAAPAWGQAPPVSTPAPPASGMPSKVEQTPLPPPPGATEAPASATPASPAADAPPTPATPAEGPAPFSTGAPAPLAPPPAAGAAPYEVPRTEVFGEQGTLRSRPILVLEGTAQWDSAFETLRAAFKRLNEAMKASGAAADGPPLTIYVSTDDRGFDFRAAQPVQKLPEGALPKDILTGGSPAGAMIRFTHKGSYDNMDSTYEAVTNWLDGRRIEAQDNFVEEYVTDPLSTPEDQLQINIYVFAK